MMKKASEVSAALAAFVLSLLIIGAASAQPLSPEALVRQVAADVLGATNRGAPLQAGEKREALALAEERILPHVDFAEATRLAATAAWTRATPVPAWCCWLITEVLNTAASCRCPWSCAAGGGPSREADGRAPVKRLAVTPGTPCPL